MTPSSLRTLIFFAIILLVSAGMVLSPVAALLLSVIALLCALPVVFCGRRLSRLTGLVLLAGSVGLVVLHYSPGSMQMKAYLQHGKSSGATAPSLPSAP